MTFYKFVKSVRAYDRLSFIDVYLRVYSKFTETVHCSK